MKLLAVVDNNLKRVLDQYLGCDISYFASWKDVNPNQLASYNYVIAMGKFVENAESPVCLWGIASEVRYFSIPSIFVDVSFEAANVIPRHYPQIKLASFQNDPQQFVIQLKTFAPQLFFENSNFRQSTNSAIANSLRYEEQAVRTSSLSNRKDLKGPRATVHDSAELLASVSKSLALSSIPLGIKSSLKNSVPEAKSIDASDSSAAFRKQGMGAGRQTSGSSSGIDMILSDLSSESSVDSFSDEMKNINDALKSSASSLKAISSSGVHSQPSNSQLCQQNEASDISEHEIKLRRSTKDVMLGMLEIGILARVVQTLLRLEMTGTLEVQNNSRCVKFEFRAGKVFSSSPDAILQGAFGWAQGNFNFNPGQMLSNNAQPVNVDKFITVAVTELYPLNSVLRSLESEFNSYIGLTNFFSMSNHFLETKEQWWQKCNGSVKLSDIMMASGADMDTVSRDIYKAWLCDEICFMKEPIKKAVKIEYETIKKRVQARESSGKSGLNIENSGDISHLNIIRAELQKVRASFDSEDGYTILGVQPGCGTKALDDAYYAWINKYHTDRFVRFKDPTFIRLANDLVILMNTTYAKLSKIERQGYGTARALAAKNNKTEQSEPNAAANFSSRIGPGRARTNTLLTKESASNLKAPADEVFGKIADASAREEAVQRTTIRPASTSAITAADMSSTIKPGTSGQFVKMSDVLARRKQSSMTNPSAVDDPGLSSAPPLPAQSWTSSSVTPDQHFQTAKKKLTLGLIPEAFSAIKWALNADPENGEYKLYHAYISFLVDPSKHDTAVEEITTYCEKIRAEYANTLTLTADDRERLFMPRYFLAKLAIAVEDYPNAMELLQTASKFNPNDVDTQRCIRYVTMQLEKQNEVNKHNKASFFAKFKGKFNI